MKSMDRDEELREQIRTLRKKLGHRKLARELGMSINTLTKIVLDEKDKPVRPMTLNHCRVRLAELGLTP